MRIEWLDEDLAFLVTLPEWADRVNFGGPATHGATYEEAVRNGREVLELLVASARACGDVLPSPRVYVPAS
jgi:predicted RNase H-like HicB family nuclease